MLHAFFYSVGDHKEAAVGRKSARSKLVPLPTTRWWYHASHLPTTCNNSIFQALNYYQISITDIYMSTYYIEFGYNLGEIELQSFENKYFLSIYKASLNTIE